MIDNIRIILVNTSHPGNIGATARAMKTMGLKNLYLVNPKIFPDVNATAMAAGADDILANANVTKSLEEALLNTKTVIGTSSRLRILQLPLLDPKQTAKLVTTEAKSSEVAIVFGRENNGLSNKELEMCNYHLYIPTNPDFASLNLAAAVQLVSYEIKMAQEKNTDIEMPNIELATNEEVQEFYKHLEETLLEISFLYPENKNTLMAKLKRLFNRARLEKAEASILRGILTTINKASKNKD